MKRSLFLRLVLAAAFAWFPGNVLVQAAETVPLALYDKDPHHLWNRLYAALMIRTVDGKVVDDLLDPPLWYNTKHLLEGDSNRRAVALLGEFVSGQPRPGGMTAMQRAVMQRDLLGVFH